MQRTIVNLASRFSNVRNFSTIRKTRVARGGGHGNNHHHHGPYEPHHHSYPDKAYFLNMDPKTHKSEGWELITYVTYALVFGVCTFNLVNKDSNDDFQTWARAEALAREKIVEEGGEIEYGKYYTAQVQYQEDAIDTAPVAAEDA